MSLLPGTPGPIWIAIADGIIWIGRKLGLLPEEVQLSDDVYRVEMIKNMEEKGFHFDEVNK